MVKTSRLIWSAAFGLLLVTTLFVSQGNSEPRKSSSVTIPYKVVKVYPHDAKAFCQGLVYDGETLYESTGIYGQSTLRQVDLETGRVEKKRSLNRRLFGEGLALVDDKLYQLTWKSGVGIVYDAKTLSFIEQFSYRGEGWGLAYDGKHLILSDGSYRLRFLDPKTFEVVKTVAVKDGRRPIIRLNELEYIDGKLYANILFSDKIVVINPSTGKVTGWLDLAGINNKPLGPDDVLNGIAYDKKSKRLLVTGKNWPNLFAITLEDVDK